MKLINEICKNKNVNIAELKGGSLRGNASEVRAYLARYYGLTLAETARQLGVTTSAVSKIYSRRHYEHNISHDVILPARLIYLNFLKLFNEN